MSLQRKNLAIQKAFGVPLWRVGWEGEEQYEISTAAFKLQLEAIIALDEPNDDEDEGCYEVFVGTMLIGGIPPETFALIKERCVEQLAIVNKPEPEPPYRVGVLAQDADPDVSIRLLGYGTYEGFAIPDALQHRLTKRGAYLASRKVKAARIRMDTGEYLYGCDVGHWMGEEEMHRLIDVHSKELMSRGVVSPVQWVRVGDYLDEMDRVPFDASADLPDGVVVGPVGDNVSIPDAPDQPKENDTGEFPALPVLGGTGPN